MRPRGLAIAWTKGAEKQISGIKRAREVREVRDLSHANEIKSQLEALQVSITAKAGTGGQLFGRITERDIAEAIKRSGGPLVDKRKIGVTTPVKSVGRHAATVDIHPGVSATVAFEVTPA